jgi:hypothetical protein
MVGVPFMAGVDMGSGRGTAPSQFLPKGAEEGTAGQSGQADCPPAAPDGYDIATRQLSLDLAIG